MAYTVQVVKVEASPLAVVRRQAKSAELSRVVPACCGEVWNFIRAAGLKGGRHVAVYLDGAISLEIGAEVPGPFVGDGNVLFGATPAGTVATTIHIGPYGRLGAAHAAICDWCDANGRSKSGPNWEIYGHWTDDPSQLRTDVFYLLEDTNA